jgi:glutamate-1-semialdehyde 2,1-aminomutase
MAAGVATLDELEQCSYPELAARSDRFAAALRDVAEDRRAGFVQGMASMVQLFFTERPVRDAEQARRASLERYMALFRALLSRGVYLPPSQWETCFVSFAHTDKQLQRTVEAVDACLASA